MPASTEGVWPHVDFDNAAELLRPAAATMAKSFPADWRTARFEIKLERTAEGPRVYLTFYEIYGEDYEEVGRTCGTVIPRLMSPETRGGSNGDR